MAWSSGRIELECGHNLGIADWDKLWVGAETYCPTCKGPKAVVHMGRIFEAKTSKDAQLGVLGGETDGTAAGTAPVAPDVAVRDGR